MEKWYFTFDITHTCPHGMLLAGVVIEAEGTYEETKQAVEAVVGDKYANQYPSQEAAGVEERGLIVCSLESFTHDYQREHVTDLTYRAIHGLN